MKISQCSLGPRHSWVWQKNVTKKYVNGSTIKFTLSAIYKCACGRAKYGAPKHGDPAVGPASESS